MYGFIFRLLPGPLWIRVLQAILLAVFVILLLMNYVFPLLNPYSPWQDSTVSGSILGTLGGGK
ncbi:hypothetical protein HMPREF3160_05695 [Arthrobacter sp. HMSC06H05]|uniref:Membrane protein n=2 Tax=Pseudoglutamicibacter albus TaxID=98671 RepID=A0A095ZPC7_9MICC|nr:hypothetical protein [Pseudoglutamicibacter albus]OFT23063.1 hypothetical protein HMPREF3175_06410 [Arthrobacter sp. HMSC08H08]OFT42223.1 hypothetical protein HMPREF3160_05695 [Arthrobacter sp. HMSC06H05]KGF20412.1 membrane protein [Pseudoglutamicibacter albus DNF00011]MCG7305014.1 hypothetical protein [Pseudoglutamicibacter albus]MDR7294561.1 hypothetical protein [Pseudoglutamicibacter albus]